MADFIESLVRARFLVASLGEITSPPWWRSQATTLVGLRALERLFPRTYLAPRRLVFFSQIDNNPYQ